MSAWQVVVLKKDTLQIIEDDLDGPVGGVPQPGVVTPSGCDDFYLHKRFFIIREVL
mgnify:CR=1 FL=1